MRLIPALRAIHRDLGFLVVGLSLVYAVSGILLNHLGEKDPAFTTTEASLQLPAGLNRETLAEEWHKDSRRPAVKRILPIDDSHFRLMLDGGVGVYNAATGHADYEQHKKNVLTYCLSRMHYNKVKGWSPVADFFAVALIVLALTGAVIVRGKRGLAGSGKWYLLVGILIPLIFALFVM